jgi:hypothetical protein
MDRPQTDEATARARHLVVLVVRTGGIAGMKRQWRVEVGDSDTQTWLTLIDECPWDAASAGSGERGADRFIWRIVVERDDDPPREADLPDSRLDGPWRTLVDRVRENGAPPAAASPSPSPTPSPSPSPGASPTPR